MKKYANIMCGILTPLDTTSAEKGKLILEALARHPWAAPTHVGNTEPIRNHYSGPGTCASNWADPFLWKNDSSKIEGAVWFGRGKKHSCLYIGGDPKRTSFDQGKWINLLTDLCSALRADFGYIHLTTNEEMSDANIPHDCSYAVDRGLTTHDLNKGLPKLCWAMLFGKRYELAVKHLSHVADVVSKIETTQSGHVFVQITPQLTDILTDYPAFNEARKEIIRRAEMNFLRSTDGGMAEWIPHFEFEMNRTQAEK
jgi:hypothetical protein